MALTDPVDILLTTNRWATLEVLGACEGLSHEQFHQKFEMGLGSMHDTLTHIMGAMQGWTDVLMGNEQRERLEDQGERTVPELVALLGVVGDELEEQVRAHPIDGIASASRGGKSFSFTRAGVLTHVTTHGMHHRAQCLNMLRQLGVDPIPNPSILNWMMTVDPVVPAS